MKDLIITGGGAIKFDPETRIAKAIGSSIQSIRSVYLIDEPTHVVYEDNNLKQEIYADPDDIILVFYRDDFPNHIAVAKAAQWADNIKAYNEAEQKRLEEWAKKKSEQQTDCEKCCEDCESCSPFTECIGR